MLALKLKEYRTVMMKILLKLPGYRTSKKNLQKVSI